jgi:hypothetical protein
LRTSKRSPNPIRQRLRRYSKTWRTRLLRPIPYLTSEKIQIKDTRV